MQPDLIRLFFQILNTSISGKYKTLNKKPKMCWAVADYVKFFYASLHPY